MAIFGKKKEEPVDFGFGYPASSRQKEDFGAGMPPPPGAQALPDEPIMPELTTEVPIEEPVIEEPVRAPQPMQQTMQRMQAPPQQVMVPPVTPRVMPQVPSLEPRPIMQRTLPEEIMAQRAPEITSLRPHIFLKIDKYKEVMSSIDRVSSNLKDLKRVLEGLKDLEEKETLKIKDSESILGELDLIVKKFDKIFTNPAK